MHMFLDMEVRHWTNYFIFDRADCSICTIYSKSWDIKGMASYSLMYFVSIMKDSDVISSITLVSCYLLAVVGATRPLPGHGGVAKLLGDPKNRTCLKVWKRFILARGSCYL